MGSGASKNSSYKLTYFNARGRAEVARLCLAAAGIKYEDVRVEQADWPALKPKMPLGFMPLLEVDGRQLSQSMAVTRFVAKRCALYGSSDLEAAKIDEIVDTVAELNFNILSTVFVSDESAKAATHKTMKEKTIPFVFTYLQKTIEENPSGSGYLVGRKLSVADIAVFNCLETISTMLPGAADKYEKVKKINTLVKQNSNITKYLDNRVKTAF